jgi:hypothetical protein
MVGEAQPLPYGIEMWDDRAAHVEELIALVTDHAVARRPDKVITLRQKSRVLADSRW